MHEFYSVMSSLTNPPNKRSHPRSNVLRDAKMISSNQRELVDVTIVDLSDGGARIQLKSSTDLSGVSKLYIPPEKMLRTAAVRWMKGNMVGLQFKGEPEDVAWKNVT
jgi:hypothetical protein